MEEALGSFNAYFTGILLPPRPAPILPGGFSDSRKNTPTPSTLLSSTTASTASQALALCKAYRSAMGQKLSFRGLIVFVASVKCDHQAVRADNGKGARVTAEWVLVAPLDWTP